MTLTQAQARCLDFITSEIEARGAAPSVRELQAHLGLASTNNVHRLLRCLEERGAIRRLRHRARAIEVCPTRDVIRSFSDAALLAEVERRGLL